MRGGPAGMSERELRIEGVTRTFPGQGRAAPTLAL
jgi:hypothetical protein